MLAIGLACGLVSSVLFNVGIAMQALEAKVTPADEGLRVSLLARLLRRPRWLAGLALGALGVLFEMAAFANAPFVVIEPLLAAGLLVLLAIGVREMGEKPGPGTLVGVIAIIAGTVLIAWGAPEHSEQHRGPVTVVVVMAALVTVSLVPFALRGGRFDTGLGANLGSACGFGATNIATKLMADNLGAPHYPRVVAWAAVAAFAGVAATISGMTALQRQPATTVVPISTAVQTFLPVGLEPVFLTENWREAQLDGLVLVAGLVVMAVGTVLVARGRAVSALVAADMGDEGVGVGGGNRRYALPKRSASAPLECFGRAYRRSPNGTVGAIPPLPEADQGRSSRLSGSPQQALVPRQLPTKLEAQPDSLAGAGCPSRKGLNASDGALAIRPSCATVFSGGAPRPGPTNPGP